MSFDWHDTHDHNDCEEWTYSIEVLLKVQRIRIRSEVPTQLSMGQ